jgi:signal peptidase I
MAVSSEAKPKLTTQDAVAEKSKVTLPNVAAIDAELERSERAQHRHALGRNIVFALAAVFAASVLLANFVFPTFRIYGTSMTPTLHEGDVVVAVKPDTLRRGDIVAFSYNNKILTKRVIGLPGDTISVDRRGNVSVNGKRLSEDYLPAGAKSLGQSDVSYPYQVPEGTYFVMGDKRSTSVDSRLSAIGCIPKDQIVGRLVFKLWPPQDAGQVG